MAKGSGKLQRAISCHAWKPDLTQLALSPNTYEVHIYETPDGPDTSAWKLIHTLEEHDSFVSGIDWSSSNLIVTAGHDRNAYVWSLTDGVWKPVLVILRISRAATSVKWSPSGNKFAVTSGAKVVPICHYEEDNNWWVSKIIKKHKSTVLTVDWHPNGKFIATGGTDSKARIFSAFLKEIEPDTDAEKWSKIFPQQGEFGELLAEYDAAASWVESIAWSPSGLSIAFVSHDSCLHLAHISPSGGDATVKTVTTNLLPFTTVAFLSDKTVVAAGYDYNPVLFLNSGSESDPKWALSEKVDKEEKSAKKEDVGFKKNISKFQDATSKGVKLGEEAVDTSLKTIHQNVIMNLSVAKKGSSVLFFTTSGLDGRLQNWTVTDKKYGIA